MQITGLLLERLRNAEYFQFLTDTRSIVSANNPVALNVKPSFDGLTAELEVIDTLYQQPQGSIITPKMEQADLRRDRALNGINSIVNGFVYHFDTGFSEPALLLQASISKYGSNIIGQSLIAETSIITNLAGDWNNTAELLQAITKLNLKEWTNELETANMEFNKLYLERNAETAGKTTQSMEDRRSLISNDIYYKLRDKLLANAEINDLAQPWFKAVKELEALIASYNNLLATRPPEAKTPVTPVTP